MQTELRVRPVAETDDLSGLDAVWGAPSHPSSATIHPGGVVVVRDGLVIGLAVIARRRVGVRVEQLFADACAPTHEVLSALAAANADSRIELYARDAPERLDEAAAIAGFELVYRQVRVCRSLAGLTRPPKRHFTFRRAREVGRRGLLVMLVGIWNGKSGPHRLPADLELEHLVDVMRSGAGEPADMSLWRVAYFRGNPAGVALVNDIGTGTGTLGYIGLLPELRGRGLGHALHAEALWLMRLSGLERYEDATAYDNAPMRSIFASAACHPIGSAVMYARDRGHGEPGREAVASLRGVRGDLLEPHVSLLRKVPCRAA